MTKIRYVFVAACPKTVLNAVFEPGFT